MKRVKLLIIILSVVLVLLFTIFALLYFATDIFKKSNNKEMFHKYIEQVNLKGFVNDDFKANYSERLKNNKYKENTKITIKYNGEDEKQISKQVNIESKRDIKNKLASSEIIVGNKEKKEMTLKYLRNEEFYGILERNMRPVYDSARRQGYEIWNI